ncbi:LexA family protein [Duganella phyllosphaerae]|uniref:LexA repressor n=1 Tax=Duganella phyllosphaerae TaxID=762836 RepID=A0A1E7W6B0_9BURK|nr:XRE family transcriptional regulator [Duganella phyllosphaerae]OEZ91502.1 LexA repressor [Duganella phyllosphaerae]
MPAQPLSQDQLSEAAKLKDLFKSWQASRKESGLPSSQEAAADMLGFGQSALAQYLNGKIPLNIDAGAKFAALLGVGLSDFSPSLADQATRVAGSVTGLRVTDDDDHAPPTIAIPMVSVHVQAGIDGFVIEPILDEDGRHYVPRQFIEENDLHPDSLVAVKVRGDSMQPMIFDGDIAVVNTIDRTRKNGGVFAMNYNGQAVVKRLTYDRREWFLASDNPDFEPVPCRGADCIVIGRVVHFTPKNFRDRL